MKFILNSTSTEFLICSSCGTEDFTLLRDKKLSDKTRHKFFLFYECPNCAGAGFWTHHQTIDKARQIGLALARCKTPKEIKRVTAGLKQQIL